MKKPLSALLGAAAGFINGLFGSGGGTISVPLLEKSGLETKKSHATSLALTLPFSIISVIFYSLDNSFDLKEALILIPFGIAGAAIGTILLKRLSNKWIKAIFGIFLIIAGGRMIFA